MHHANEGHEMYADLVPRHPSQASLSLLRFPSSVDQDIEAFLSIVVSHLDISLYLFLTTKTT